MQELPRAAHRYIVAIVVAACTALSIALRTDPNVTGRELIIAAVLAAGVALAWRFPVQLQPGKHLFVDVAPALVAVLTLPAGWAMVAVGGGTIAAHLLRSRPWDIAESSFNGSRNILYVGIGGATLALLGVDPTRSLAEQLAGLVAVPAAMAAMFLFNGAALALMIALRRDRSPWRVFIETTLPEDPVDIITVASLSGLAIVAAILLAEHAWAGTLLLPPIIATLVSLRRHTYRHRIAATHLAGSQSSLAEAQRIARLGNWDWELASGSHRWSDQVSRILGFARAVTSPNTEVFLERIHPADRDRVVAAMNAARERGRQFSLDHRIVLADGTERFVHLQGEIVRDDAGRPERMVGTIHDITERKTLETQLSHRAFHDALTDLPNRAYFTDRLERALSHPRASSRSVAVLFLDLDGFKLVNDGLGHDAGDRLLIAVADRLRKCLGPNDLAARFGGDEFTVLIDPAAAPEAAVETANRIAIALREPFTLGRQEAAIAVSIGIAHANGHRTDAHTLLRDADTALYEAKASGKARTIVFEPRMNSAAIRKLGLAADLHRAVDRGEIVLHFQPIVDLESGRIAALEALVRWQHPTDGLVPPNDFLPLAEESGLIVPIGDWVLREACLQIASWGRLYPGAGRLRVGVNLSVRQLHAPGLAANIARALRETGIEPDQLELEVTEQIVAHDFSAIGSILNEIQTLGVRLALDDVGSGNSSLGHFRRFRFDALKLDRLFVADLDRDSRSLAVAEAVAGLASRLGIEVTAEGIETTDDLIQARSLGCKLGQGFCFAHPLPPADIATLLDRNVSFDVARNVVVGPHRGRLVRPPAAPAIAL